MGELSDEIKRKIEENRQKALAKLTGSRGISTGEGNMDCRISPAGKKGTRVEKPTHSARVFPNHKSLQNVAQNPTAQKAVRARLESARMVAIIEGGDALMFKGLPGAYYKNAQWHVPLTSYKEFMSRTEIADGVPESAVDLLLCQNDCSPTLFPVDQTTIPAGLVKSLFPFQMDGVQWGLSRNGRFILADDMGLGKSIQALAIAAYYRPEWPLLILAPASMVATWSEQVKRWFQEDYNPSIAVAYDGKAVLNACINIVSYDLAVRLIESLKDLSPGIVIADESHCLRNGTTKRVKTLGPFLKKVGRLIMLSGTPALSRPIELFSQLGMVAPKLFPKQLEYGLRYCSGRREKFGWNFRGASNLKELGIILEETIMLRRNKAQVLSQLPRKIRQQVFVRIPERELKELKALASSVSSNEWASLNGLEEAHRKGELMALWRKTGEAKLPSMWAYVQDLLDIDSSPSYETEIINVDDVLSGDSEQQPIRKILLFAHHQNLMDELEKRLEEARVGFIRIDGKTPPSVRHSLCNDFQTDRKIRVAVLSITAASIGLTLTAATLVVFCELFFNPGILVQAEDRAHRIGQTDCVTVHYLLSKGTIDDRLWPLLLSKLNTLESVGLGENEFSGMLQVEHDERQLRIDKFLI